MFLRSRYHPRIAMLAFLTSLSILAQQPKDFDLSQASLEDLMNIQVTSVSKKAQTLSKAGAAVFVISAEDIRRSGATNIPDLLRTVPGIHVAKITGQTYAISIRGFTERYGDKVLVLIDGRSVYTPFSSGVNWDQQDVPLENIERIEVIRGPGGTVWGANAVNGVINIITKNAKATQGGLLSAEAGSQEFGQGLLQYGGTIGQKGAYRVFGDYNGLGNSLPAGEISVTDGWHKSHGGFRSDWDFSSRDIVTVQGDFLQLRGRETADVLFRNDLPREAIMDEDTNADAGNILGRWKHTLANGSDTSLQVYYDRYHRVDEHGTEARHTVDLDFQHHLTVGSRQEIVWGVGYRATSDHTTPGYAIVYKPDRFTDNLFSTFLQDDIRLTNSLWLTLGSKLERNSYTGTEYEPSAQLVWKLSDKQALWASASRAIRQPCRSDFAINVDAATFPAGPNEFAVLRITGNPSRKAERLHDFEAGYRAQVRKQISLDVSGFSSYYYGLQTQEPGQPFTESNPLEPNAPPYLVIPQYFSDGAHARNYGGEISVSWNVNRRWKVSPGYSYLQMHVAGGPSSQDPTAGAIAYESPKHQFQIHSLFNLTRHLDWDTALYNVGRLADGGSGSTPGYVRIDTRLGWRMGESLEFSVVGQNLQSPAHAEYHDVYGILHSLAQRAVLGKVTFRF